MYMFVCTKVMYEYMNSLRNAACNLFVNTHVRIKIYREFYHIIYIANDGSRVRILFNFYILNDNYIQQDATSSYP